MSGNRPQPFASARRWASRIYLVVAILFSPVVAVEAQQRITVPVPEQGYLAPPTAVQQLLRRDPNFATLDRVSPDGNHFLVPLTTQLSTLTRMAEETYRLGRLELRPTVDRQWHLDTWGTYGLRIYSLSDKRFQDVALPSGIFLSDFVWSPDGRQLAFLAHLKERTEVWTADVRSGRAASLSNARVMATIGTESGNPPISRMVQWTPQGSVITLLVPPSRGPEPQRSAVATTPTIRHALGRPAPVRIIPYLLTNEHEESLFEHYTRSQIAELRPGQRPRLIGEPGMYLSISLSPDGKYILATRIVRPFSYWTGYEAFPQRTEVLDLQGKVLAVVAERALQLGEDTDQDAGSQPRELSWRPDGAALSFLRRDPANRDDPEAARSDRVYILEAPFEMASARAVAATRDRLETVRYSRDSRHAFATASRGTTRGRRNTGTAPRQQAIAHFVLGSGVAEPHLIHSFFDPREVVAHPGTVFTQRTGNGIEYVSLASDGRHAFLAGAGLKADFRPRPFVDRVSLADGNKSRIFEGASDMWERPLVPLDADFSRLIISRESKAVFPDSYLWTSAAVAENLTRNTDPFPEVTAARRIDFEFVRRDGVRVPARVSLPIDYQEGQRVPAFVWSYPREHNTTKDYEQYVIETTNHNAFRHMGRGAGSDVWLTQGFARIEPDIPIIADPTIGDSYNDKYLSDLKDGMYAAIRAVDELRVVDVDRLAHGGHSYGGFATMNVLAHTPFFKAGIAGSGAYNRTLTHGGFQGERRVLWEAPNTYIEMSPFFKAHQINTPVLMYHGHDDNNGGTWPIQSERMMHALTMLGKPAVLIMYPYESHGQRAIETLDDQWARWLDWLNRYVKNPPAERRPVMDRSGS
jgi:dipeptidyl aminopeptidase/acylaminoacyl peptidase